MNELLLALGVFIVFHLIPAAAPVRRALISTIGKTPYIVGYSMMSIAILAWVSIAYANADTHILWPQWPWTRWVPLVAMPFACVFLVSALSEPNPLSVGVRADRFDPAHPGIVSITRHPLIWALGLWALAHIAPNGDSVGVALFGLFAVLALVGPWSLDRKKRRALGEDAWRRLSTPTSSLPFWAVLTGRTRLDLAGIGIKRIVLGLALYLALLALHPDVIGVSPLPLSWAL